MKKDREHFNGQGYGAPQETIITNFLKKVGSAFMWACLGGLIIGCDLQMQWPEEQPEEENTPLPGYSYVGRVYDGATGARLKDYTIDLIYANTQVTGDVALNGRYMVGPLEALHDFTVQIKADGYRSFLSHNAMIAEMEDVRSYYYDAYLFPYDLPTPKTEFYLSLTDNEAPPNGWYRLRPTAASSLYGDCTAPSSCVDTVDGLVCNCNAEQQPAGVEEGEEGKQLWENDEDLQFQTLFGTFESGQFSLAVGELVYGVTYELVIYGVNGYQEFRQPFTAGIDGHQAIALLPLQQSPLELAFVSTELGVRQAQAQVVVVFNQPVELDPLTDTLDVMGAINDAFFIQSPDQDTDGDFNVLDDTQRAVTLTVNDRWLTLNWDPSNGLEEEDPDDAITHVTFGGLNHIVLRPVDGSASTSTSLSALIGSTSLSVALAD